MDGDNNNTGESSSSSSSDSNTFQRWSRQFSLMTGVGLSKEEQLDQQLASQYNACEKWKRELMKYSPAAVFMLKHLKLSGCPVSSQNILCAPCDETRAGGFSPPHGAVILCQGRFLSKAHMEDTLVHELVHMYDHCKFKVDWNDLRHHACSEIRANNLSGDCRWTRELGRGHLSFSKQHQECVRRRAVISVVSNPACPDKAAAEKAVNEVWDSCFQDTRPFDEIY